MSIERRKKKKTRLPREWNWYVHRPRGRTSVSHSGTGFLVVLGAQRQETCKGWRRKMEQKKEAGSKPLSAMFRSVDLSSMGWEALPIMGCKKHPSQKPWPPLHARPALSHVCPGANNIGFSIRPVLSFLYHANQLLLRVFWKQVTISNTCPFYASWGFLF